MILAGIEWKPTEFRLKYRFGFIALGTARFRGMMPDVYLTKLPPHPYQTQLPQLNHRPEVFVMRSHPIDTSLPRLQFRNGLLWYVPSLYKHRFADLTGSFDTYLNHIPSKERSTLHRKVRKFFREWPTARFQCYRTPEELLDFHSLARSISAKTYQERFLKAGLPDTRDFIDQMCELGLNDSVRGFLLSIDQRPVAYLYSPAQDSVLLYDHLGYDQEYSKWSPGTVLQYLALEELFREQRFAIFDFEEGEGQHKRLFATDEVHCADVYAFVCRPRAIGLVLLHGFLGFFTRTALSLARFVRIRHRVKALLKR